MAISGIEDEFDIASNHGMDRLVYVYTPDASLARDARLEALVVRAQGAGITTATYSTIDELKLRIRNDVTAVVSSRFADQTIESIQAPSASALLRSVLPEASLRFRRTSLEAQILAALSADGRLAITGPLGSGKTVILAQLAVDKDWTFVDGQGLSTLDVLARAANQLRARLGLNPVTLTTEDGARRELSRAWQSVGEHTLAVDSPSEPRAFLNLPVLDGQQIVVTSRDALSDVSAQRLKLPPLVRDEIEGWVTSLRGEKPSALEVSRLQRESEGSPLFLRFYALANVPDSERSLKDLEIAVFTSLPPRAREIISYIAIHGRPIGLDDAHQLVGADGDSQSFLDVLASAAPLLRETSGYLNVIHEHPRQTILDLLRETPTTLSFFAVRLGQFFEKVSKFVFAFYAYREAQEWRHADRILRQASHQAMLLGGGAPAVGLLQREVELASATGEPAEQVDALLALAYVLRQTGAVDAASRALSSAETLAAQQGDEGRLLRTREIALAAGLSKKPRALRIADFLALKTSYSRLGDHFSAARVDTEISVEYVSAGDFPNAELASLSALTYFESVGDEFGCRVARVNVATAISGQDGRETEAAKLALSLERNVDPSELPRERCVICNLLTRYYRKRGETALAAQFATEAIAIGEQLQDHHIVAMNRANLGNILRDEAKFGLALEEYRSAERSALAGHLREDEAAANELIASVLNAQGRFAEAMHHAEYAVALARDVRNPILTARAGDERASAFRGLGQVDEAVQAYGDAVIAVSDYSPGNWLFSALVDSALSTCADADRLDLKFSFLARTFLSSFSIKDQSIEEMQLLFMLLPRMAERLPLGTLTPTVALTLGDVLMNAPTVLRRKMIQRISNFLLSPGVMEINAAMSCVAGLLLAHNDGCLTINDLCDIADRIVSFDDRLYFKPHSDGAAHWTVQVDLGQGAIVTVSQLDDSPRTALVAMLIALLFTTQQHVIREKLLPAERLPRNEAMINVISKADFEQHISLEALNATDMSMGFIVTESADLSRDDQPPIVVICADDFNTSWQPTQRAVSDVHRLFASLLRVFSFHVLGRVLEPAVLFPKIRETIGAMRFRNTRA